MTRCGSERLLGASAGASPALERRHLADDAVRPELAEQLDLAAAARPRRGDR